MAGGRCRFAGKRRVSRSQKRRTRHTVAEIATLQREGRKILEGQLAEELTGIMMGASADSDTRHLYKISGTQRAVAIYHQKRGTVYPAAYSRKQRKVVEILPDEVLDKYKHGLPAAWFEREQNKE